MFLTFCQILPFFQVSDSLRIIMYILRAKSPLRFLNYSTITQVENILEPLQRHLIEVKGDENSEFLQGLITNDINNLSTNTNSMFSMFLNTKGRILYDSIIYRFNGSNSIFVECDKNISEFLEKHLKTYRVKRKIEVINLRDQYVVYALFNTAYLKPKHSGVHIDIPKMNFNQNVSIFKDPRATELGFRVITKVGFDVNELIKTLVNVKLSPQINNRMFRYHLGIGEGLVDHPVGSSFPLECNCDYLHGVSFNKGCYIGQELTARTYHTGVVRKRLMSLKFTLIPTKLPNDNVIIHENVKLGKLRGIEGDVGLALLNVQQALGFGEISVGNGKAIVKIPDWWPIQALKVDNNLQKI